MFLNTFFLLVLFIIGAAVGSFTSVVIYRIHKGEKGMLTGRSKCPDCSTQLKTLDLIPIVSYLTLRGRCRFCNKDISYMYPLLEILSGFLFAFLYLKFPFFDGVTLHLSSVQLGLYLLYAFYTFVLLFTFFYDLHYLKVADEVLLPAIFIGLIATLASPLTPHFFDALLGGVIAAGFFGLQYLVSKGKWVGLGDARVGGFMGVILGWKMVIVALFLSYIFGSIASIFIAMKKKKLVGVKIPFAPFLVLGTFAVIFFGEDILGWYLSGIGF